jgi:hypothetical protein
MKAEICFPHFVVLRSDKDRAVYYLPTEFQHPKMYRKRRPLSGTAHRAGWRGFTYDRSKVPEGLVQVFTRETIRTKEQAAG